MEIRKWRHTGVFKNGVVASGGVVKVDFEVSSSIEESCHLPNCTCCKSHWISVNLGLENGGIVNGITYYFASKNELMNFVGNN